MANFINDKEIHDIITISALTDRRESYFAEIMSLKRTIVYQMTRTDNGMSVMGRARVVAQLVNRMDELDRELERIDDELARYEPIEMED